jgi:crossover junction endodeoxyribonuclease RuvC
MILAVDMGTHTGIAMRRDGGQVIHQTAVFERGTHPGTRFKNFRSYLTNVLEAEGSIDRIIYEQISFTGKRVEVERVLFGFEGNLVSWAALHRIPVVPVKIGELKKKATGKANAKKPGMIAKAEELGYHPRNDNEADALLLLELFG